MTPDKALHSPIYRAYLLLTLGLLAFAGAALLVLRFTTRKNLRPVWLTYRSWLVMVPLVVVFVFLGRGAVIVGVTVLAVFAFKEFARATGLYEDWWMTGAVYLGVVAVGVASLVSDPFKHLPGWWGLFLALPVYAINLLLLIPVLRDRTRGQLQAIALSILGFMYLGWMFGHLGFLANADYAYGYLLYTVLATEVNDVAAFTFGRTLGRYKLRPAISPGKTWGGALGALGVSLLLPWALRGVSFPHFSAAELWLTGLIFGVGGQAGDLCISVIKRDIGIKDMGAAIPGHGGVLDRIDSLIFTAPLFLHLVQYFHGVRG